MTLHDFSTSRIFIFVFLKKIKISKKAKIYGEKHGGGSSKIQSTVLFYYLFLNYMHKIRITFKTFFIRKTTGKKSEACGSLYNNKAERAKSFLGIRSKCFLETTPKYISTLKNV